MDAETVRAELLAALDREEAALAALLPRFDDAQWRDTGRDDGWSVHDVVAHVADSTYGLALMALGELPLTLDVDAAAGVATNVDALNAARRAKNAELPRAKVLSRLQSACGHARRAFTALDPAAPLAGRPDLRNEPWLRRIVDHIAAHRAELEQLQARQ